MSDWGTAIYKRCTKGSVQRNPLGVAVWIFFIGCLGKLLHKIENLCKFGMGLYPSVGVVDKGEYVIVI